MTNDEIEKLRQGKKEAAAYMLEKLKQQSSLKDEEIKALLQDEDDSILVGMDYLKNAPKKTI